ncbi:type II toxin-antitoxin system RelE/ParE family toxin [Nonomuraea sp. MCN248]|uniref:Type II toxin-antitoxin system RelE/ParE family toxin n=1 Tax=Nonomuraea corallina TaxID=2989783 RepID=A0ABT4SC98_9ACTN|nr:type II toxin-antitoxin system RelE/ParE family toxin [Nonomuraea corallina]MDA0634814.1 type II toxin-antitoxin system RelE/ParE family toxin [Nonomuraea corallina]
MQDEWDIYVTDEVDAWIEGLDPEAHRLVIDALDRLAENGPALGRPLVGKMNGSRIANLKELRPRSTGRSALRLLFVFDPRRDAIILVAADKIKASPRDPNRWYEEAIPHAERLYEIYLKERAEEDGRNP